MAVFVAFLRGIGPTNPNMRGEHLRAVVEGLGFERVRTVLGTGNVVFETHDADTSALEALIEPAWPQQLGFESRTIVRSRDELGSLVAADPYAGGTHARDNYQLVTFVQDRSTELSSVDLALPAGTGIVAVVESAGAVLTVNDVTSGTSTPDVMRRLEKALGPAISSRTWPTVLRVVDKMSA